MPEHSVSFNFHARYYKLGEITSSTKQVWFVLHGYGQLAQYFIRKFSALEAKGICVIAPEGLSRFYLEPVQGAGRKNDRVGATWMTKENRLTDIENYVEYLNSIYRAEITEAQPASLVPHTSYLPITVLGFSQGSATASRWVLDGRVKFNRLILWAGMLPPDMDFETGSQLLKGKEIHLVYGTRDPFLADSRFEEMKVLTQKLNAEVRTTTFDGEHDIDEETLLKF